MKRLFSGIVVSAIALSILTVSVYAQESQAGIPSWIKVVAGAWSQDQITDAEYSDAMKFLIEQQIIEVETVQIDQTVLSDEQERLFQLEINQKDDRILILENQATQDASRIAELEKAISDRDDIADTYQQKANNYKDKLEEYMRDNPPLDQVAQDQIRLLQEENDALQRDIEELEKEIQDLKDRQN